MKRDKRLHPLSGNHQHGLAFAQEMKRALAGKEGTSIEPSIEALKRFWAAELHPHFRAEEEILLPPVRANGDAWKDEVERLLSEHQELWRLFLEATDLRNVGGARQGLLRFADLLIQHIRYEEGTLFPKIEQTLSEAELDRIGRELAGQARTGAAGGTGAA